MNFQPTDYLADLNLEFDSANMSPVEEFSKTDLDIFTQTEFFDLDVFSSDLTPETKEQKLQQQATVTDRISESLLIREVADEDVLLKKAGFVNVDVSASSTEFPSFSSNISTPSYSTENLNEIKRKRHTAASARFRIKKKMKEQQMEQQASDLRERLMALEERLKTLETENKCLKQLLIEKNEKKNSDLLENIKKRSLVEEEQKEIKREIW